MKLPAILTLGLFVLALLGCAGGIYLKAVGTVTWGQFAGFEAATVGIALIVGRRVLFDAQKK